MDQNNEKQPQWYENFLNEYDYHNPKTGDIIEGTILSIEDEGFLVDVGLKRDALIQTKDLSRLDEDYVSSLKVGDVVTVFVLGQAEGDRELQVSISKGIEYASWKKAEKIMEEGLMVDLEVVGHNRGGLLLKFDNLRGFLPFSLVPEIQSIKNPKHAEQVKKSLMGSTIEVKVIEVAQYRNRLIFSALAAQEEKRSERLKELKKGQIIKGRVSSIVDFGVFVDLDGVDGLVHISQIDWKKVKHPTEILKVGDEIDVKIISIDLEKQRVSLSRKAVLPSPWDTIGETLEAGDYIEGKVTRQVDFGAFVRLPYGIEGLIHISQVGYSSSQDPKTAIKSGETVLLKVLEVNPEKKRIALSMRQVPLEKQIAWAMEDVSNEYDNFSQKEIQDDADLTETSITELETESEELNNISSDNQNS
jgi:small subunit ribosomal protein S1